MKEYYIAFSLLLIFCVTNSDVYAQKTEISQKEFSDLLLAAEKNTNALNRRLVSIAEVKFEGEPNFTQIQKSVSEIMLPDRRRYTAELKPTGAGKINILESVRIGDVLYNRKNGGEWKTETLKPNPPSVRSISKPSPNITRFYLGKMNFNNQTADVYQMNVEFKLERKNPTTGEISEYTSNRIQKYWVSRDKLMLKLEMEDTFNDLIPYVSRTTIVYEYNPNIDIKAPLK